MAPSTAINTRTLSAITTVLLATTTHPVELQVQIVTLVQQEHSVLLEQPHALIVLQGNLARQLGSLRVKTAARGSTACPLEPQATLHV
jgi:hypothetical protein